MPRNNPAKTYNLRGNPHESHDIPHQSPSPTNENLANSISADSSQIKSPSRKLVARKIIKEKNCTSCEQRNKAAPNRTSQQSSLLAISLHRVESFSFQVQIDLLSMLRCFTRCTYNSLATDYKKLSQPLMIR